MQRELEAIAGLIEGGQLAAGQGRLLALWRRHRVSALAGLIESIGLLVDLDELPPAPERWWRWRAGAACYPWHIHPWLELPAPDPRTTRAIVLSANHVFELLGEYRPRWPKDLSSRLIAHGDPRSLEFLGRALVGRHELFGEQLAQLAGQLPPAAELGAGERAVVDRIAECVARAGPDEALRAALVRATDDHRKLQLIGVALTRWLPDLGWLIHSPLFERGVFVGCTLQPIPESLRAAVGLTEWRTAHTLHVSCDPGQTRDEHPGSWVQGRRPDHGRRTRAALIDLLMHPVMAGLRTVGRLALEVLRGLADAGHRPPWTRLCVWHEAGVAGELTRLGLPALAELDIAVSGADASVGPDELELDRLPASELRRLCVWPASPRVWALWLAERAVPATIEEVVLRGGDWTGTFRRAPDGGWTAALELRDRWDIFDSEFQDPPTPGAEVLEFLGELATDRLTSLEIDDLGELDEDGQASLVAAARRQLRLARLRMPDDGVDEDE